MPLSFTRFFFLFFFFFSPFSFFIPSIYPNVATPQGNSFVARLPQTNSYLHWLQFSIKHKNLTLAEGPIEAAGSSIWDLDLLSQLETLKLGSLRECLHEAVKCLSNKSFKAENMLTQGLWG